MGCYPPVREGALGVGVPHLNAVAHTRSSNSEEGCRGCLSAPSLGLRDSDLHGETPSCVRGGKTTSGFTANGSTAGGITANGLTASHITVCCITCKGFTVVPNTARSITASNVVLSWLAAS